MMTSDLSTGLITGSFIWVMMTILAYIVSLFFFRRFNQALLLHPIVVGGLLIAGLCLFTSTSFEDYALYSKPLAWLLGPVTVALAVPVYQQLKDIIELGRRGLSVILLGGFIAPALTFSFMSLSGFSDLVKLSSLTKSITSPIAIDTARLIGGIPELAAAIVIFTGLISVVFSQWVFRVTKCNNPKARGIVLGTIGHAVGTSQAFQKSLKKGSYASLALCVNGIVTAIVLPLVFFLWGG